MNPVPQHQHSTAQTTSAQTRAERYLPICQDTLEHILDDSTAWEQAFDELSVPELASLWLLARLTTQTGIDAMGIERKLAQIIELLNSENRQSDLNTLRSQSEQQLCRDEIKKGYQQLHRHPIHLLDQHSVEQQQYLTGDGHWNYQWTREHHDTLIRQRLSVISDNTQHLLSNEQTRLYRELQAQTDEHVQVLGYAGTGKTTLIKALCHLFEKSDARILVIAERWPQLQALGLTQNKSKQISACTFGGLARMIIPDRKDSYLHQVMRRSGAKGATQRDDTLIRHLGIQPTAEHDSRQIVIAVRSTLYHYCQSSDTTLSQRHIPSFHARRFQPPMHTIIAEYARRLWDSLLSPPPDDYQPVIRDVHRIKWAALNDFRIPHVFTHVLVDESHDLPKPINQILHRSPQARAILGDDYQNLRGHPTTRSHDLRQRELVQSVRSGKVIESIINPIIEQHPSPMKTPFLGNAQANLNIRYTPKTEIPPAHTAILCSDTWELVEWTQRLAPAGKRIRLLNDPDYLSVFVNDCIALYSKTRGPRHPELFRYRSWDQLASANAHRRAFTLIQKMLDKGYSHKDWQRASLAFDREGPVQYTLGLAADARNLEFGTVMLSPDIVSEVNASTSPAGKARIYIAITRAREQLILPESLRGWVEEVRGQ